MKEQPLVAKKVGGTRAGQSSKSGAPVLIAAVFIAAVLAGGGYMAWAALPNLSAASRNDIVYTVKRQDMKVVVNERGNLESANNEDLICEVEARNPGSPATSIKWIVPEGHIAKKGEVVVEFDSASLEDLVSTQRTKVEQAKASLTTKEADLEIQRSQNESDINAAKTTVELAEIDLRKYLEGDYVKERRGFEGDILIAEEEVKRAKERLDYSIRLNKKGYVSSSEVESDELAVTRAENNLSMSREEMRVLDEYTKVRTVKELQSLRDEALRALDRVKNQAKAKEAQVRALFLAEKATYEAEVANLKKYESQLSKCKLTAPINGMVTYANETGRFNQGPQIEEGASVRERQKVIRIPDLTAMQVNVKVHEAKVSHITVGQPANIKVESMPSKLFKGTVKSVATVADSQNFFSTGVQQFSVLVAVDEKIEGLKPGMTAEVEILAQEIKDTLPVPVQAVIERKGKAFSYVKKDSDLILTPVELGTSNGKMVAVLSGLQEGDQVVENIAARLTDEDLRRVTDAVGADEQEQDQWAGRDRVAGAGKQAAKDASARNQAKGKGSRGSGGSPAGGARGGGDPASTLSRFDTNGDGKISKDEIPESASWLSRLDADGNGEIDATELANRQGRGGSRGGRSGAPTSPEDFIKSNDKDGDGKLSASELPERMQSRFSQIDTNSDGAVDQAEISAMFSRFRSQRRSGGGAP